jgi:hypothetical protein
MPNEESLEKVNLGMAEFIAKLIDETMEAVIDAQNTQNEQLATIRIASLQSLEEFASKNVSDTEAVSYLSNLIAPSILPAVGKIFDINLFQSKLNITFIAGDFVLNKRGYYLTQQGYDAMVLQCKIMMSEQKHEMLKLLFRDGLPKIVIDNGEITAKVAFTAVSNSSSSTKANSVLKTAAIDSKVDKLTLAPNLMDKKLLDGKTTLIKTNTTDKISKISGDKYLPETKIILENANQSSNSSTTSLYGEVTLRFKTIY